MMNANFSFVFVFYTLEFLVDVKERNAIEYEFFEQLMYTERRSKKSRCFLCFHL